MKVRGATIVRLVASLTPSRARLIAKAQPKRLLDAMRMAWRPASPRSIDGVRPQSGSAATLFERLGDDEFGDPIPVVAKEVAQNLEGVIAPHGARL